MNSIFAQKFRKLRELRDLSQTELARRLGLKSNSYVYDIERGVFVPPTEKLGDIAKALGVDRSLLDDLALESKIEALGVKDPRFITMFKDYPRLTRRDKQAIIAAYNKVTLRRNGPRNR